MQIKDCENQELANRMEEKLLSIEGEFTSIDLVKLFNAEEFEIVYDVLDFLIDVDAIGFIEINGRMVYFVNK